MQNSEKRSHTWWVGQSFSHRRVKRKGLGKSRGAGDSLTPAPAVKDKTHLERKCCLW